MEITSHLKRVYEIKPPDVCENISKSVIKVEQQQWKICCIKNTPLQTAASWSLDEALRGSDSLKYDIREHLRFTASTDWLHVKQQGESQGGISHPWSLDLGGNKSTKRFNLYQEGTEVIAKISKNLQKNTRNWAIKESVTTGAGILDNFHLV